MAENNRQPPAASRQSSAIKVEVAYALPERQALIALEVEEGASVREAIERSGILRRYPAIELGRGRVGIFGRQVSLEASVRDGDRVEVYRPLVADPRQVRRERAERRKRVKSR